MAEIAAAYVSILPSFKGGAAAIDKQMSGPAAAAGKNAGKRFGGAFSGAFKAVLASVAVVKVTQLVGDSIAAASDLAESQSKVGVVFGKSAAEILKASKTSATAMGLSQRAYLEATGTLGNLLVSLDIAPDKAAGFSKEMVKLAGDMASFNNVSPEEALNAIRSGLTGETEPLKRFGVNMNEATLRAQALKLGLVDTTKNALTPQQKVLAAHALIMAQTGTAQGDFARTSSGLANQQRILSAQFDDVKAKIGTALLPVMTSFVSFLNTEGIPAVRSVGEKAKAFTGFISDNRTAAIALTGTIVALVAITKIHAAVMAVEAAGGLLKYLSATRLVTSATKIYTAVQWLLNAALSANPIGLVVIAIAALAAGLVIAYKRSETFREIVQNTMEACGKVFRSFWNDFAQPILHFLVEALAVAAEGFADLLDGLSHVPGFGWIKDVANGLHIAADQGHAVADSIRDIPDRDVHVNVFVNTSAIAKAEAQLDRFTQHAADSFPHSPVKKGPLTVFNKYGGIGGALMHQLSEGIRSGGEQAQKEMEKHLERLKDKVDGLKNHLKGLKDASKSLAEGVAAAFTGDLFGATATDAVAEVLDEQGNIITAAIPAKSASQNFIESLMGTKGQLTQLLAAFKTLKGFGWASSTLAQLFQSGNAGLILELAADKTTATQAEDLFGDVTSLSEQLGSTVSDNKFADNILHVGNRVDRVTEQIKELRKDLKQAMKEQGENFSRSINGAATSAIQTSGGGWSGGWHSSWA